MFFSSDQKRVRRIDDNLRDDEMYKMAFATGVGCAGARERRLFVMRGKAFFKKAAAAASA